MDKKFLNKVLDQIVRETEIDYENEKIFVPFLSLPFIFIYSLFLSPSSYLPSFSKHCIDVYGLNKDEIQYVWYQFRNNINNKIK